MSATEIRTRLHNKLSKWKGSELTEHKIQQINFDIVDIESALKEEIEQNLIENFTHNMKQQLKNWFNFDKS